MGISTYLDVLFHGLSPKISQDTGNTVSFLSEKNADLAFLQSIGISVFKSVLFTQIPDFPRKNRNSYRVMKFCT